MIILRDYQVSAIEELLKKSIQLLSFTGNKKIVFKSPTGSGKTVMMAEYLKQLQEKQFYNNPLAYIWTAPHKLHEQSKEKLETYYRDNRAINCSNFEDLSDKRINPGEVLFFNWESINKKDNIYIRENEQDLNLSTILENTRDSGTEIILVIDESHYASETNNSLELINLMNPKLTIDVSATPSISGDEMVVVQRESVVEEGMIKKSILINPGFKNKIVEERGKARIETNAPQSSDEFVIKCALEKRMELKKKFDEEGSRVNPLLLIQLPEQKKINIVNYQDVIEKILTNNHNITRENGKLAIYLSEDKKNLEDITHNDSDVEVMIFKQAIAIGWDCPRASILALFRDWKDFTFSTQTLGRIMRMPELKHYFHDDLNTAFIYTTVGELSIIEDLANEFVTVQSSKRKKEYKSVKLISVHSKRIRAMTRLSPKFRTCFLNAADELDLKNKIKQSKTRITHQILSDGLITDGDQQIHEITAGVTKNGFKADSVDRELTDVEIQNAFNQFVINSLPPIYPEPRSVGRVKEAIYNFFQIEFPTQYQQYDTRIQSMVIDKDNSQGFLNAINRAKEIYEENVSREAKELVKCEWDVPYSINFNNRFKEFQAQKCIMEPCFLEKECSQVENDFAKFLDNKPNVEWWFKNGDRDATFFAVPYGLNEESYPFYVDWIVKFKDNRLGLFDTKSGLTANLEETKAKSEGLSQYIREQNKSRGLNLFGGIVTNKDGSWKYFNKDGYKYNSEDLSDWVFLE